MSLPKTFQFSASSLQDYVDCPRRFQLRYLLRVSWPAPEAEPIAEQERHSQLARNFHQLVHQHLLGLPIETLSASVQDPDLERWWQAYLAYTPSLRPFQAIPEVTLSTPVSGYRLMAQFDAILNKEHAPPDESVISVPQSQPPSLLIIDWKTYAHLPLRAWLAGRLQTRVYPFVLVEAGMSLFDRFPARDKGSVVNPGQVEMRYWLAEYPQLPEVFVYNTGAYQADLAYLSALVTEITEHARRTSPALGSARTFASDEIWSLTSDVHQCRFCNYRSLCGRGDTAGQLSEYVRDNDEGREPGGDNDLGFDLDWGQIQEIVY